MRTLAILTFFILFQTFTTRAQQPATRLDSLFNALYQYRQINGNVLAAENGQIVYQHSFGMANFKANLPNRAQSKFTLASVSKIFTSTAVLQLKEKGKLKLDETFSHYFPDFPYPDITIRHLLSHTSGLPDYDLFENIISKHPDTIFYNRDIVPALKQSQTQLHFKPGEKWEYSNLNFCLLALLVEKLAKMPFPQYLDKNIFEPAQMKDTYILAGTMQKADPDRTINYDYPTLYTSELKAVDSLKKFHWRLYNVNGFIGQGNIITTTGDMLKFDQALYAGKILKPETQQEAFTPTKLNNGQNTDANVGIGKASYGLGWFILNDESAGKVVFHTGGVPGAVTIFLRNITQKQTVVVFDNTISPGIYRNGLNALHILDHQKINPVKKSLIRDYGTALVQQGVDAAFTRLQQLKTDTLHYVFKEDDMNELGLRLLIEASFAGHKELAAEVLKLNVVFFPNSFNTYDSYGQLLAAAGKTAGAIWMYQRSIELNPNNEGGKRALKRLMK